MDLRFFPLSGEHNKAGITALVEHLHLRQLVYTVANLEENWNTGEPWLEVGESRLRAVNYSHTY